MILRAMFFISAVLAILMIWCWAFMTLSIEMALQSWLWAVGQPLAHVFIATLATIAIYRMIRGMVLRRNVKGR